MGRWLRLYADVPDDPKVQRLPPALFKRWINLLCVAARNEGRLPSTDDLQFILRTDGGSLTADIAALREAGLLDEVDGALRPHNWSGRQYASDSSTERVRKHRKNRGNKRNVAGNVSRNDEETANGTGIQNRRNALTERSAAARRPQKGAPAQPRQWVGTDDPRWPTLADAYRREHPGRTQPTTAGPGGTGWHFDAALVEALATQGAA